MNTGGASYLPVFVRPEAANNDGGGTTNGGGAINNASGGAQQDPLYAALLGGKIGSALGPAAERETTMNTLDEPIEGTIVWPEWGKASVQIPSFDCLL